MYKNPIFIFFLIVIFIRIGPFLPISNKFLLKDYGFGGTLKYFFGYWEIDYIPILAFVFIKLLMIGFKSSLVQKILYNLNIICIIFSTIFYILYGYIIFSVSSAFRDW